LLLPCRRGLFINWPYKLLEPFLKPQFMKLRDPALNGLRQKLESL
jgi:hypothetical protein